jgi:hypothetical protein
MHDGEISGNFSYLPGNEGAGPPPITSWGDGLISDAAPGVSYVPNSGGGVYVQTIGFFQMYGGTIKNNESGWYGGGVYGHGNIVNPAFMYGGTISENKSGYGGGVYLGGTLGMSGGEISNNTAILGGGVVHVGNSGYIGMYGGTISGNTAQNGGGVVLYDRGKFYMEQDPENGTTGTIKGNTVSNAQGRSFGGGVLVAKGSRFYMSDGTISDNKAGSGGGVAVYTKAPDKGSEFYMSDGTISGNTAIGYNSINGYGGGVYIHRKDHFYKGKLAPVDDVGGITTSGTGGTIYGYNGDPNDRDNNKVRMDVYGAVEYGHAVYLDGDETIPSVLPGYKNSNIDALNDLKYYFDDATNSKISDGWYW